jgi:hypothetical protein
VHEDPVRRPSLLGLVLAIQPHRTQSTPSGSRGGSPSGSPRSRVSMSMKNTVRKR